jgi:hypothetical protein
MTDVIVEVLYGLGGTTTSPGMVQLVEQIKPLVKFVKAWDESDWQSALDNARTWTVEKIVLIGYSMGANNITYIAQGLKHVDLLCAIQPTLWEAAVPITSNTAAAIEWYNPTILETGGLGGRKLTGVNIGYIPSNDSHPYADNDPRVHNRILAEIHKLAA